MDLGNVFVDPTWPDIRGWDVDSIRVAEALARSQRGMPGEINSNRGKNLVVIQVALVRDKT